MRSAVGLAIGLALVAFAVPAKAQRDCRITRTCPPAPAPTPAPAPAPRAPRPPAVDPCIARWTTADRTNTIDAYSRFANACPRHRNAPEARNRIAGLQCDVSWPPTLQNATLSGFEDHIARCAAYRDVSTARNLAAAIRANPLNIPGLIPTTTAIPREGLSPQNGDQARLCEGGNGAACSFLGFQFSRGIGAPRNALWAASLYARACAVNDLNGCGNLGVMLDNGDAIRRDLARARIFYQRACDGGSDYHCSGWAGNFSFGSRNSDFARAVSLEERACRARNVAGCLGAAYIYEYGATGVPRDLARARQFVSAGLAIDPNNANLIARRNRLGAAPPAE